LPQGGLLRFGRVQSHYVGRTVVQHHSEIVELENAVQLAREIVEQFGQTALRSDGF
jgi:hypothetical protein